MASPDHPFCDPSVEIPRFLFRGFNEHSGGGEPELNTTEGIKPHAFLYGYDIEPEVRRHMDLSIVKHRASSHMCNQHKIPPSPFSSWTHDWRTALTFTYRYLRSHERQAGLSHETERGYIAVLDTWALGDENMRRNKIFHATQFGEKIQCEWLIWGPVSGPGYRCVPVSAIREAVSCRRWPAHDPQKQPRHYLRWAEIRDSMFVAGCFQRDDDTDADLMLAVAAAELGNRMLGGPLVGWQDGVVETDALRSLNWPQPYLKGILEIFALCKPVLSGRPLVPSCTALVGFPQARLMYTLLRNVEDIWGRTKRDTPWARVDWQQLLAAFE